MSTLAFVSMDSFFSSMSNHGLGAGAITLVLLGFGLAGAAANFTAGVTVRRHLRATLMGSGLLIACSALLLAIVPARAR